MRAILRPKTRQAHRARRHLRVRKKIRGTAARPRLVVYRSLKHIYAQLADDDRGVVLFGVSDLQKDLPVEGTGKVARAHAVGQLLGAKAREAGVTTVVFDRAGYRYHGRVRAVAEGARKGGLEF